MKPTNIHPCFKVSENCPTTIYNTLHAFGVFQQIIINYVQYYESLYVMLASSNFLRSSKILALCENYTNIYTLKVHMTRNLSA